jgi:hypothetical protein
MPRSDARAVVAREFQPDKRYRWQYEVDPEAQRDNASKLDHERLA